MSSAVRFYSYFGPSIVIALVAWGILWRRSRAHAAALGLGRMLIVLAIILTTCYWTFVALVLLAERMALGFSVTQPLWLVAGVLAYVAGGQAVGRLRALTANQ